MAHAKRPVAEHCTKGTVAWRRAAQPVPAVTQKDMVIVANRLPVQEVDGEWRTSPGGLVSALKCVLENRDLSWIGWAGTPGETIAPFKHDQIHHHPVSLSPEEYEGYYEGFANGTLWPLYHDAVRSPEYHRSWWRPYVEVNRRFAQYAAESLAPNGTVWVHDYHLHLVPQFLRTMRPDAKISFFLHIPFPPEELFAQLPWRREILEGMLGADLVAFQTRLGAQNFSRLCRRFTNAVGQDDLLKLGDRLVKVDALPISVDVDRFDAVARNPEVQLRAEQLRRDLGGRKIFLGVDRLDYTKGIDVRLRAFETFLENNPAAIDDVVFVQVAVPSRECVDDYVRIRQRVEQLVGQINGAYGRAGKTPIHYLYRNLPTEELVAYYLAADVMLVTPFRDGMNLVAKEYVSCRTHDDGILILSEFAGAAREMLDALLVNPHDIDGLAATMAMALKLPSHEVYERMSALRTLLKRHDVHRWAKQCLEIDRDCS